MYNDFKDVKKANKALDMVVVQSREEMGALARVESKRMLRGKSQYAWILNNIQEINRFLGVYFVGMEGKFIEIN